MVWSVLVGRITVCTMRTKFGEHRRFIEQKKDKHSVPWHLSQVHGGSTEGLELFGIAAISMVVPEGGEVFQTVCMWDIQNVYFEYHDPWLNEELEINTLIEFIKYIILKPLGVHVYI